jgi:tRNA-dependent cyclodipeptide synthase
MKIKETSLHNIGVLKNKKISCIIGVSINNSYFKDENIRNLLIWASSFAKSLYIMIPDEPAIHTLLALGYSKEKAERKARLKSNNVENKCVRIISDLKIKNVIILRWKDIKVSPLYVKRLNEIRSLYTSDQFFKDAIDSTTKNVILGNISGVITNEQINLGINFLFEELAFILHSTIILGESNVMYVYHKTMELMKNIIAGKYDISSSLNVHFITID